MIFGGIFFGTSDDFTRTNERRDSNENIHGGKRRQSPNLGLKFLLSVEIEVCWCFSPSRKIENKSNKIKSEYFCLYYIEEKIFTCMNKNISAYICLYSHIVKLFNKKMEFFNNSLSLQWLPQTMIFWTVQN